MGDVDVAVARRRRLTGGLIFLAGVPLVVLAYWLNARDPSNLVILEFLRDPIGAVVLGAAFLAGAVPLLAPQRQPPPDLRSNRWFIAFMAWGTMLQGIWLVEPPMDRRTLARSPGGDRAVVLYHPDTPYACLKVRVGSGLGARTVGEIGAAGSYTRARFESRNTVMLDEDVPRDRIRLPGTNPFMVVLDERTGRPQHHLDPCPGPDDR
jgi:hypothetical protein